MERAVEIVRLQEYLPIVRGSMGWSAEELGERIGVTRQTIHNIEKKKTDLTKTQYLAIRSVIYAEIENSKNTEDFQMVSDLLSVLVDSPDDYSPEQREQLLEKAKLLIPAILDDSVDREVTNKEWAKTAGAVVAALAGAGAAAFWISRLIKKP